MKKILLSCVTCLLALGLVTACEDEVVTDDGTVTVPSDTTTETEEKEDTTQGDESAGTVVIERDGTVNVHIGAKNSGQSTLTSGVSLYARAGHSWSTEHGGDNPEEGWDLWYNNTSAKLEAESELAELADLWCVVEDWDSSTELSFVIFASSATDATNADDYWTAYILPSPDVSDTGEENLNFWTTTGGNTHCAGLSLDWVSDTVMEDVTDIYVVFTFDFSGVTTSTSYQTDVTWSVTTASIAAAEEVE